MHNLLTVAVALAPLWWLAPIVLGAWIFAIGLARAAAREMPPMPETNTQEQTW